MPRHRVSHWRMVSPNPFENGQRARDVGAPWIDTIIGHSYGSTVVGAAAVVTQWTLGPEPDTPGFGAIRLQADPGPAGPLGLPSVDAHSSYWNKGNKALDNMGAIIAGQPPPYVSGGR